MLIFMLMSKKVASPPQWISEFKRRTAIIDIIASAYENQCSCDVCERLRDVWHELGELFMPGGPQKQVGARERW